MRHISCSFSRASGQGSLNSITSELEVPTPAPRCGDAKASSVFWGLPVAGDEEVKDSLRQRFLKMSGDSRRAASFESQNKWESFMLPEIGTPSRSYETGVTPWVNQLRVRNIHAGWWIQRRFPKGGLVLDRERTPMVAVYTEGIPCDTSDLRQKVSIPAQGTSFNTSVMLAYLSLQQKAECINWDLECDVLEFSACVCGKIHVTKTCQLHF